VAALDYDFDGVTHAAVGLNSGVAQIIEAAQDVVVPESRVGELEPAFVDGLAGAQRAEHSAIE